MLAYGNAIGFVGSAHANDDHIKEKIALVPIANDPVLGILDSIEIVRNPNDSGYPILRPLFFNIPNDEFEGKVYDWVEFALSEQGQDIVSQAG